MGVSRVTIREAEIALQAIGRLEIKTGSGVYVSEKQPEEGARLPEVGAFEVTEARLLVESETAALAAHNISDDAVEHLAGGFEAFGEEPGLEVVALYLQGIRLDAAFFLHSIALVIQALGGECVLLAQEVRIAKGRSLELPLDPD